MVLIIAHHEIGTKMALAVPATPAVEKAISYHPQALIWMANTELRLPLIGAEIKKTARNVNALEHAVIPGIRSQIRHIEQVRDQQEQEDISRLKHSKGNIEAGKS